MNVSCASRWNGFGYAVASAVRAAAPPPGAVDVAVTTPGGTATATGAYTYLGAPTVTVLSPAAGPAAGTKSADELAKFQEFRTTAINNNRSALAINRTMMAPISK